MNNKVEKNKPLSEIVKSKFSQVTHFSAFISILFVIIPFFLKTIRLEDRDKRCGVLAIGSLRCTWWGTKKMGMSQSVIFLLIGYTFSNKS